MTQDPSHFAYRPVISAHMSTTVIPSAAGPH